MASKQEFGAKGPHPALITIERVAPSACGQAGEEGAAGGGDSGVRLVTLRTHAEGALNSLTVEMGAVFKGVLEALAADKGARAVVITGEGRAFSAGGDFGFIEDRIAGTPQSNQPVLAAFYTTFLALRRLPLATIAAINGPAVGGGMGLAMACDMRLAAANAKMSFNFVKLGLTPGMASTAVLPAATNHQVACRLLLTGDLITAQEALALGLVLEVVVPDQLLPAAQRLAGRIASASPSAASQTLALLRRRLPWPDLEAAALEEAALQSVYFVSPDCREGVDSVRGKRPAAFGPKEANGAAAAAGAPAPAAADPKHGGKAASAGRAAAAGAAEGGRNEPHVGGAYDYLPREHVAQGLTRYYVAEELLSDPYVSPAFLPSFAGLAEDEIMVVGGGAELMLPDIRSFAKKLWAAEAAGDVPRATYYEAPGQVHSWPVLLLPSMEAEEACMWKFYERALRL